MGARLVSPVFGWLPGRSRRVEGPPGDLPPHDARWRRYRPATRPRHCWTSDSGSAPHQPRLSGPSRRLDPPHRGSESASSRSPSTAFKARTPHPAPCSPPRAAPPGPTTGAPGHPSPVEVARWSGESSVRGDGGRAAGGDREDRSGPSRAASRVGQLRRSPRTGRGGRRSRRRASRPEPLGVGGRRAPGQRVAFHAPDPHGGGRSDIRTDRRPQSAPG
jgi:hypothetical protein